MLETEELAEKFLEIMSPLRNQVNSNTQRIEGLEKRLEAQDSYIKAQEDCIKAQENSLQEVTG